VAKGVALLLSAVAGALVAMQPPINSRLGKGVGTFAAASISFLVGTIALIVVAAVAGGNHLGRATSVPWWAYVGGFIGAVFVASSLVTVRTLGAGGVVAATVAGQLTCSVVLDRIGAFGLEEKPISFARVAGVVLLAAGVFLIVRD
jgi:bacterial/archaeal transporter family-2 protein